MLRRLPILAVLAAAALAGGCGGDGGPEGVAPATWAEDVCGSLAEWQSTLQEQSQALAGEVVEADSPQAARAQVEEFLDGVIQETDAMIGEVQDAGTPAVEDGDEIAADFVGGLETMRRAFQDAAEQVQAAPTDDAEAFQRELVRIGQELQAQGEGVADALGRIDEEYDAEELAQAFRDTPACRPFTAEETG